MVLWGYLRLLASESHELVRTTHTISHKKAIRVLGEKRKTIFDSLVAMAELSGCYSQTSDVITKVSPTVL